MDEEEIIIGEQPAEEETTQVKDPLKAAKIKKLMNLKYFKNYTPEQIEAWYQLRHGNEAPPENPDDIIKDALPASAKPTALSDDTLAFDKDEYKKKYNSYLARYRKEYGVDMNETNDAEALKALVRYVIQLERADEIIMEEQASKMPDHRTLKGLGDFQRSLQMNLNELQEKLGITRKARKEKTHDDIPQYIKALQDKAKDFWDRKTVAVKCETCMIELARYWLNFPDKIDSVEFIATCEKCGQKVVYAV